MDKPKSTSFSPQSLTNTTLAPIPIAPNAVQPDVNDSAGNAPLYKNIQDKSNRLTSCPPSCKTGENERRFAGLNTASEETKRRHNSLNLTSDDVPEFHSIRNTTFPLSKNRSIFPPPDLESSFSQLQRQWLQLGRINRCVRGNPNLGAPTHPRPEEIRSANTERSDFGTSYALQDPLVWQRGPTNMALDSYFPNTVNQFADPKLMRPNNITIDLTTDRRSQSPVVHISSNTENIADISEPSGFWNKSDLSLDEMDENEILEVAQNINRKRQLDGSSRNEGRSRIVDARSGYMSHPSRGGDPTYWHHDPMKPILDIHSPNVVAQTVEPKPMQPNNISISLTTDPRTQSPVLQIVSQAETIENISEPSGFWNKSDLSSTPSLEQEKESKMMEVVQSTSRRRHLSKGGGNVSRSWDREQQRRFNLSNNNQQLDNLSIALTTDPRAQSPVVQIISDAEAIENISEPSGFWNKTDVSLSSLSLEETKSRKMIDAAHNKRRDQLDNTGGIERSVGNVFRSWDVNTINDAGQQRRFNLPSNTQNLNNITIAITTDPMTQSPVIQIVPDTENISNITEPSNFWTESQLWSSEEVNRSKMTKVVQNIDGRSHPDGFSGIEGARQDSDSSPRDISNILNEEQQLISNLTERANRAGVSRLRDVAHISNRGQPLDNALQTSEDVNRDISPRHTAVNDGQQRRSNLPIDRQQPDDQNVPSSEAKTYRSPSVTQQLSNKQGHICNCSQNAENIKNMAPFLMFPVGSGKSAYFTTESKQFGIRQNEGKRLFETLRMSLANILQTAAPITWKHVSDVGKSCDSGGPSSDCIGMMIKSGNSHCRRQHGQLPCQGICCNLGQSCRQQKIIKERKDYDGHPSEDSTNKPGNSVKQTSQLTENSNINNENENPQDIQDTNETNMGRNEKR